MLPIHYTINVHIYYVVTKYIIWSVSTLQLIQIGYQRLAEYIVRQHWFTHQYTGCPEGEKEKKERKRKKEERIAHRYEGLAPISWVTSVSGCVKSGHSYTSFASRTYNTGYYTTIICMHIIVYFTKVFPLQKNLKCAVD